MGVSKGGFFPPDHGVNNSSISLFISSTVAGGVLRHTIVQLPFYSSSFILLPRYSKTSVCAPQLGTVRAVKENWEAARFLAFRQSLGLTHLKYHFLAPGVLSFHAHSSSSAPAFCSPSCPHFYLNHCSSSSACEHLKLGTTGYRLVLTKYFLKNLSVSETWYYFYLLPRSIT